MSESKTSKDAIIDELEFRAKAIYAAYAAWEQYPNGVGGAEHYRDMLVAIRDQHYALERLELDRHKTKCPRCDRRFIPESDHD